MRPVPSRWTTESGAIPASGFELCVGSAAQDSEHVGAGYPLEDLHDGMQVQGRVALRADGGDVGTLASSAPAVWANCSDVGSVGRQVSGRLRGAGPAGRARAGEAECV